jgi:hypothetical protein
MFYSTGGYSLEQAKSMYRASRSKTNRWYIGGY